jgi:glycosyltransferase involved in cell wall biosynthesis
MSEQTPDAAPAVLQIVPALNAGGAERSTLDIARALVANGIRALVASEGGRLEFELVRSGGELIRMPVARKSLYSIFSNASAIANVIRRENVVLVHARSRAPAWSALMAARRTKVPFITTYHGVYNGKTRLKRWYNSVMARGDAVIANSEWTASHILATYRFQPKHLTIIPRGIDLDKFDPAAIEPQRVQPFRNWWGAKDTDRVILLPGRLSRWKGQLVFLRALGHMKQKGQIPPNVRAVIAGDAQGRMSYLREVMNSIARHDLLDVALVADHITDMPAAYLAADIVVSASTEPEAFGRIPPEAAAMGRPVIATDHGGARETVRNAESGLLVKPNSTHDLADAMGDLLSRTPEALAAMGAKGRAHIVANYTVDRMCLDTLHLYSRVLEERAGKNSAPAPAAA